MLQSTGLHSVIFFNEQLCSVYFNTVFLCLTAAAVQGVRWTLNKTILLLLTWQTYFYRKKK